MNTERGRNRGADPQMVVTAEEMRDDPGVGVVERPIERRPARSPRGGGGVGAGLGIFLAIAAAVILGLILWALLADDDAEDVGRVARIDEITDDPRAFQGRVVSTFGTIDRVLGPQSFVVDNSEFIEEDEILVVSAQRLPNVSGRAEEATALHDAPVRVTGMVRTFRIADVERDLGVDLDDNLFRDWDSKPVIVARDINLRPLSPEAAARTTLTDFNAFVNQGDKAALVSRQVRLTGLKVQAMPAPNVFWVGPSNDRLLFVVRGAVTPGEAPNITVGDTITISGLVLRVPPMDQARQLWNLDQTNIGQLQNQQVYIQAHQMQKTGR